MLESTPRIREAPSSSPASISIGSPIIGGTATEILYTDSSGNLGSDANFTRDDANDFLTRIYSSGSTGTAFTLIDQATKWESGYADNSRISSVFTADVTKTVGIYTNNSIVALFQGDSSNVHADYTDGTLIANLQAGTSGTQMNYDDGNGITSSVKIDNSNATIRIDDTVYGSSTLLELYDYRATFSWSKTAPASPFGIMSIEDSEGYMVWNKNDGTFSGFIGILSSLATPIDPRRIIIDEGADQIEIRHPNKISLHAGVYHKVTRTDVDYDVLTSDYAVYIHGETGNVKITLPQIGSGPTDAKDGTVFIIADSDGLATSYTLSVQTTGGALISGAAIVTMTSDYQTIKVIADETNGNWILI